MTLFIIRPGDSVGPVSGGEIERDEEWTKRVSSVRRSIHILSQLLRDRNLLVLLATVPVAKLVNPITEIMFQYIPRRFDLSLGSVSFMHTNIPCYFSTGSNSYIGKSSLVNTGNGKLDLAYSHLTNHQGSCAEQIPCHIYKS